MPNAKCRDRSVLLGSTVLSLFRFIPTLLQLRIPTESNFAISACLDDGLLVFNGTTDNERELCLLLDEMRVSRYFLF